MSLEQMRPPERMKKRNVSIAAIAGFAMTFLSTNVDANGVERRTGFENISDTTNAEGVEGFESLTEFTYENPESGIQEMNAVVTGAQQMNRSYIRVINEKLIPGLLEEMTPEDKEELDALVETIRVQVAESETIAESARETLAGLPEFYAPRLEITDDDIRASIERLIEVMQEGPGVYITGLEESAGELQDALGELEKAMQEIAVEAQPI